MIPGVGKTAIAEGLAHNIVNKNVIPALQEYEVYNQTLDPYLQAQI